MTTKEGCSKKVNYHTRRGAKKRARFLRSKGYKLRAYKCDQCDGFHLTSKIHHQYKINARNKDIMANKPANSAQKKWMESITDWSVNNLHRLYGDEYSFHPIQRHHVLGRSAKQNKVHIGHWFILPVPFELHDPNVNHEFHVGKCKKAFVSRFGTQRSLFNTMYQRMKEEGYIVPDIEVHSAIMSTSA